jgi:hypothetical protein
MPPLARHLVLGAGAVLAVAACAGLVPEAGHPCPCDEGSYACCSRVNQCVARGDLAACEGDAGADGDAGDGGIEAGANGVIEASSDGTGEAPADDAVAASSSDAANSAEDARAPGADGACDGGVLSFVPSGGVAPADLDGCGLLPVTLPVPPPTDSADAGTDGGDDGSDGSPGYQGVEDATTPAVAGDTDPADTVIDVDTGEITRAGVVIRAAATQDAGARDVQAGIAYRIDADDIAIFTFGALTIPQGTTLKLSGSKVAGVVIASASTIVVDGVIEARAMGDDGVLCEPGAQVLGGSGWSLPGAPLAGPTAPAGYAGGVGGYDDRYVAPSVPSAGFGPGGVGGGGGAGDTVLPGGGAGGGHAGAGGRGDVPADGGDAGGPGGGAYDMQPLDVASFRGGSGGGGGGGSVFAYGGAGGSGGGAIRLVAAASIEIGGGTVYGGINASGCGGGPGVRGDGTSAPGGGGAGGAIVVEAPVVTLFPHASLLAAGGSGGYYGGISSTPSSGPSPSIGIGGPVTACPVGGGAGGGWQGVNGEDGNAQPTGCGGGGAAGWIRVNAAQGGMTATAGAILAPHEGPWLSTGAIASQ